MIKCEICNGYYKRIDNGHLQKHKITPNEYQNMFPNSSLISEESIKLYSNKSKEFFDSLTKEEKSKRCYIRTKEQSATAGIRLAEGRNKHYDRIFGFGSIRNKKISIKKFEYWSQFSKEEISAKWKLNKQTERNNEGEERYLIRMRKQAFHAYNMAMIAGKNKVRSSLEEYLFNILVDNKIDFIEQYELSGWHFDCYLPIIDTLVEFDGDFWHPESLESCKYPFQMSNYWKAIHKENFAKEHNYQIFRIRESKKDKIYEIIKKVQSYKNL